MPTALPGGRGEGKGSPKSYKSPTVKILQSGTNFQTRIISHPCGTDSFHLPAPGRELLSPRPTASRGIFGEPGAGGTASARKPAREDRRAPGGAKFRGRARGRGGLRNLAFPGSSFLLLSGFLVRSRTLFPLPHSHPFLFSPLRLRVGSDVTSAEIPPNSTAQWRAAEPGCTAGE